MRVDIKSKIEFKNVLQKIFNNNKIPILNGCSINSKNIYKGDMFLPIKGSRFDGHDFIDEAIKNGAQLILTEKKIKDYPNVISLHVKSIMDSITTIASKWRINTNCEIIGITGSNGKTSTKEILNRIISKSKKTMFSKGNYNSTIGLPISMFSISKDDDLCILEMGANKSGEIKKLCKIAQPNHGLITNISNAHNKYFGGIENIAKNKLHLFESLPNNGYAFINMDDKYLNKLSFTSNIITYGFSGEYDFSGKFLDNFIEVNGSRIKLPYPSKSIAQNYLATYSVSATFGINPSEIIAILENAPIYSGRGEIVIKNNRKFINDTYNANLSSCINGINAIVKISARKRILVLGDMHELGGQTKSEHIKLGKVINKLNIDALFGLGEYIKFTLERINSKKIFTKHFNSKRNLISELNDYSNSDDIIYVKGSRSMKMEEIIYNEVN